MTTAPDVPMSVLADVYESLVAAIYLDGGKEAVERFIDATITNEIDIAAAGESGVNYKSQLQHHAQREHGVTPTYHLVEERGPDHCKCFNISARSANAASRRRGAAARRNRNSGPPRTPCANCAMNRPRMSARMSTRWWFPNGCF